MNEEDYRDLQLSEQSAEREREEINRQDSNYE